MKIIIFAWTSVPLLAGRKTRTRREWDDKYAATYKAGEIVQAYDRSARFKGKRIALIKIHAVWTHMNYDVMEPKGYKWVKDEKVSKNSHWGKGA